MENQNLFEKKLDSYQYDLQDFVADDELMVTITLNEYRRLVTHDERFANGIRELDKLKKEKEELLKKIKELEDDLADMGGFVTFLIEKITSNEEEKEETEK